jgi:hypothetical protein
MLYKEAVHASGNNMHMKYIPSVSQTNLEDPHIFRGEGDSCSVANQSPRTTPPSWHLHLTSFTIRGNGISLSRNKEDKTRLTKPLTYIHPHYAIYDKHHHSSLSSGIKPTKLAHPMKNPARLSKADSPASRSKPRIPKTEK